MTALDESQEAFVGHVLLSVGGSSGLSQSWEEALEVQAWTRGLALREIQDIRLNEEYWLELRRAHPWQLTMFNINRRMYNLMRSPSSWAVLLNSWKSSLQSLIDPEKFDTTSPVKPTIAKDDLTESPKHLMDESTSETTILTTKIEILRKGFDDVAVVLGRLTRLQRHFATIYEHITTSDCLSAHVNSTSLTVPFSSELVTSCLTQWMEEYIQLTEEFLPHIYSRIITSDPLISAQIRHTHQCVAEIYRKSLPERFPLKTLPHVELPPNNAERFWFRRVVVTGVSIVAARWVYRNFSDGTLQALMQSLQSKAKVAFIEHVKEPLDKLTAQVLETVERRDAIVTRSELIGSQQSLERMLRDFAISTIGPDALSPSTVLSNPDLKLSEEDRELISSLLPGTEHVLSRAEFERGLEILMHAYEHDLQSPIRGIVGGDLFRAILIQVQKLKVHAEAAMLKMDQILASNELNLAAVAALPAFGAVGMIVYYIRQFFTPKAFSTGDATVLFRSALSDVERSINRVIEADRAALVELPKDMSPEDLVIHSKYQKEKWAARGELDFRLAQFRAMFTDIYKFGAPSLERFMNASAEIISFPAPALPKYVDKYVVQSHKFLMNVCTTANSIAEQISSVLMGVASTVFGSTGLVRINQQQIGLGRDIRLLERPETDVSLESKLKIVQRMRQSYRVLAILD